MTTSKPVYTSKKKPCLLSPQVFTAVAINGAWSLQGAAQGSHGHGASGHQACSTPQGWCCIIFVERKMSCMAIDAVLRMTPALQFLASSRFMGLWRVHHGNLPQCQGEYALPGWLEQFSPLMSLHMGGRSLPICWTAIALGWLE